MNYYERHIGDYLKDTAHLSLLEHGIYTRLLDVYYTKEAGIEPSEAARLVGARSRDEKNALATVVSEFFVLMDGIYTQPRCDREIERFKDKQRKAKASADARWSHTERNANASPNAMRTHSEGNAPSNQTPVTRKEISAFPPGFERFWEAYPRKVGKPSALKAFARCRVTPELLETLLSAVKAQAPGWSEPRFIPHPATWLNDERWKDEPSSKTSDVFAGAI
jgi:uncharacterized protein YdaU (DUF1376 family)